MIFVSVKSILREISLRIIEYLELTLVYIMDE